MLPTTAHDHRRSNPSRSPLSASRRAALARAYFAQLPQASHAASLGIDASRVLEHLSASGIRRPLARLDFNRLNLADVAIASACADGVEDAWALLRAHEPTLGRVAERMFADPAALSEAPRMMIEMRRATLADRPDSLNLRRYTGERPIRLWLFERLCGRLAPARRARSDGRMRLRSAMESLDWQRDRIRLTTAVEPTLHAAAGGSDPSIA